MGQDGIESISLRYVKYSEENSLWFEYDMRKSASNFEKHGIDFEFAQRIWNESHLVVPARNKSESRFAVIGYVEGKCWTAIAARREGRIRIISARKASPKERQQFHEWKRKTHA